MREKWVPDKFFRARQTTVRPCTSHLGALLRFATILTSYLLLPLILNVVSGHKFGRRACGGVTTPQKRKHVALGMEQQQGCMLDTPS
jgi:hypothetical protein